MALIPLDMALGPERQPVHDMLPLILALRCLASGFILTSLLWASALAAVLDRQMFRAAAYLAVAAVCSLVGIIHSPLTPAVIGWPWNVYAAMLPRTPQILCQSPYHWTSGYVLAAAAVMLIGWTSPQRDGRSEVSKKSSRHTPCAVRPIASEPRAES